MNTFLTTVHRDLSLLFARRGIWWLLALWASLTAIIFCSNLESFLGIQPALRAKNFRYGVTDIAIFPYLTSASIIASVLISCLCSKLFHHEQFSAFSLIQRSIQASPYATVAAKWGYIAIMAIVIIIIVAIPLIVCAWIFSYDGFRVVIFTVSLFMLLSTVGGVTMLISQYVNHSVVVTLSSLSLLIITAVAAHLTVEPAWLSSLTQFMSPLSHIQRIATGVVMLSDIVFFVLITTLTSALSIRRFNATYLSII